MINRFRLAMIAAVLSINVGVLSMNAAWGAPSMFTTNSLEQGREQAKKENKYLLLDFTARWCGPCHQMDATTWEARAVQDWVKENAIAVQIDVDEDKKTSTEMRIEAMPTIIIFTPSDYSYEFDRMLGYKNEAEMLDWFTQVKNGLHSMESLKARYAAVGGKGGRREVEARYDLAKGQVLLGQLSNATEHYVWLWTYGEKEYPEFKDVKYNKLPGEVSKLVSQYAPAKKRFADMQREADKNSKEYEALTRIVNTEPGSASGASAASASADSEVPSNLPLVIGGLAGAFLLAGALWFAGKKFSKPKS